MLAWGLSLLFAMFVAGIAVWSLTRPEPSPSETVMRFPITLPEGVSFTTTSRQLVALSPDGGRLVYVANNQLYLREMDQMEAAPIRGTDTGASGPFFSPDGQWVGFFSAGEEQLKKVSVTGGSPITMCDVVNPYGASWGADDTILVGQGRAGILRVSANGGTPEILIPMDSEKGERAQGPQMLPGGDTVLFTLATTSSSWNDAQIVARSLESGERRVLIEGGSDARYVPTGHIVYLSGNTLLAVPFDVERLEVTGGPVPVVEGVARTGGGFRTGQAHATISDSGSLVYVSGIAQTNRRLAWVDRDGGEEPLPGPPGTHFYPRLSPDGARLAVIDRGDVWIHTMDRGTSTRLTFTEDNNYLAWTPDGERVIFSSSRAGVDNLFWKSADGSDEAEQLLTSQLEQHPDSVSPDGNLLAFHQHDPGNGTDLWLVSLEGDREPQPFLQTPFNERGAVFSPNGRWLAYASDESGRNQVYVRPFPGPGGKYQISREGGDSPVWRQSGQELFYRGLNNEMMVVEITAEGGLMAGSPRLLFEKMRPGPPLPFYDVAPSGERFVMSLPDEDSAGVQQINVVLNWFEELKRLVPTN